MNINKNLSHNQKVGQFGETLAKKWLIKRGYKIIGQNIRVGRQEIDILAKIKDFFVFVEVKTRASDTYGTAEDAISGSKINNLKKGIMKYIIKERIDINNIRIDLLAIDINKSLKMANIKHYKDIV